MSELLYCHGTALTVPDRVYFPGQNVFIAVIYFCFFWIALVPQIFLLVTCMKKHLLEHSCYKLMFAVCVLDILNLVNIALIPSFLSFFDIHHCNSGPAITYFDLWFSYSVLNVILALNRLLEFVSKEWTEHLFQGFHTWLWMLLVLFYPALSEFVAPRRFYFYDSMDGVWLFRWIDADGNDTPNYFHILNNTAKMTLIVISYILMLALFRRKLGIEAEEVTAVQKKLSIQACVIAAACVAGSVGPFIVTFHVIRYFSLNGFLAETMWMMQHSAPGFVYVLMNQQVRRTYREFAMKFGVFRKFLPTVSVTTQNGKTQLI